MYMGTICIFLGVIFFITFTGGGFYLANEIIGNQLYMSLLAMNDTGIVYLIVVGVCAFIGLLICLNLVMHGINSNKLNKLIKMHRH